MFNKLRKNIVKVFNMSQFLNIAIIILLFIIIIILLVNPDTFINTAFKLPTLTDAVPDIQGLTLPVSYMNKPTMTQELVEPSVA